MLPVANRHEAYAFRVADRLRAEGFRAELVDASHDTLGARVRIGGSDSTLRYTVVGVVDDVRHNALVTEVKPQFYATLAQYARAPGNTARSMSLVVHAAGDAGALAPAVRAQIRSLDPPLPVSEVRTMDEVVNSALAADLFTLLLLSGFALGALLLAAVGVYGVVAEAVTSRTREIGLQELPEVFDSMLAGGARGRTVVRID